MLASAVFTVVIVGRFDFGSPDAGQFFGFAPDGGADIGSFLPGAVGKDLADAATALAEMPVCTFTVAVVFFDVDFHVVGRACAECFFETNRVIVTHRDTSSYKIQGRRLLFASLI